MFQIIDKDMEGMVLRIERSSVHDGDGFRTVVFLKGCPLRCQWCSTPESQSMKIEKAKDNVYGKKMTVEEVIREIRKDSLIYFISQGGVTISGGEVFAQTDFARAILQNALKECIDTTIETSFYTKQENVEKLLPFVNTTFVDIKFIDKLKHKFFCGADNDIVLNNLLYTNQIEDPMRLIVRVPLIPGVNDSRQELESIGQFCQGLKHLRYVQLLPYHRLGSATYAKLNRPYLMEEVEPPTAEHMEACRDIVRKYIDKVT